VAERRAIYDQWRRVPFQTRLEVLRLAKRGERHADGETDAAAVRYAHLVLERPPFLRSTAVQFSLSCALLILALLTDDALLRWCAAAGGGLCLLLAIYNWDLRRDARKILAVPRDAH
jgi:hypothetical protein